MPTILPFLGSDSSAFEPETVEAMSRALDAVCAALGTGRDHRAREVIAGRIIELARRGEIDSDKLRDRLLLEAGHDPDTPRDRKRWRGQQQPRSKSRPGRKSGNL